MSQKQRGADALVGALSAAGVRHIFSLSGNHIMPIYDALFGSDIALFHTRHEAATVHMADAYARITGEVGIAMVTGGPGHANAVSALYTAQMAEAPLVLLSGHAPNNQLGMGAFQEMRQADMAAPVTKAAWTCASADDVATDIAKAIRIARSGRPGPVHLSLPSDALEQDVSRVTALSAQDFEPQAQPLEAGVAKDIWARLSKAQRPIIVAGPACMTRRGRPLLQALQAACGIPVVGTESPRGVADPALGAFAQMLAQADCVLLLNKRMDFTLKFGQSPAFDAACRFLQVDPDAEEIERGQRNLGARLDLSAQADAWSALNALTQSAQAPGAGHADWLKQVQQAVSYRPPAWDQARSELPGCMHPVQAMRPLQALLDSHPDAVFISDGGEIGQWAQACLRAPHRVVNGVAGSIGSGLSYALAARVAVPDAPVIAVMGDGTIGFHISEFDTAVRYRLPCVVVVGNDQRWNAEYQIQLRDYGKDRTIGCELEPTRYDQVAVAFGGHGEQVTRTEEVLPAAQRALASGKPACLNVMIEGVPAPSVKA